ncbi:hypothetical protein [Jiangella rhizosphaerae]|uniref:Secreted protein n=1 Tax=Jiangella rhizosphaerae TaxID=2293569 RepID=A0A418KSQ3_9ACTN|nr:hypothetical protein [Jiangella rhizosphaerae]RIQ28191.1 hypothetical protein DY240_09135 [Jiangella rhizosphaerae]
MRTIATALVLSVVAAGLAGSVPAGAAGVPIDCPVSMASVGDDGHYRSIGVSHSTGQAPEVTDFGAVSGLTSIRSLATGSFDADTMIPEESFQETTHLGTGTNVIFRLVARADNDGVRATAENLASRWGGFRRTVMASSLLPNSYLYALHDSGYLYRYLATSGPYGPAPTAAGRVAGFGTVRDITLIGRTPQYDALLANTTTGRLILVKIPTTARMTATTTTIRSRTWQVFDHLAIGNCSDASGGTVTTLIGVNSATGEAYAYRMGFVRDASTPIQSLGRLAGTWRYPTLTTVFEATSHPRGA